MFEAGKKYQRLVITKKRQSDIAFYECIYAGNLNSLFKTYSISGEFLNEILIPNHNFSRFELFSDDKHRIEYLNKSIEKVESSLRDLQIKKHHIISEEIKLINNIKMLKTKVDGKERTLLSLKEAEKIGFYYSGTLME